MIELILSFSPPPTSQLTPCLLLAPLIYCPLSSQKRLARKQVCTWQIPPSLSLFFLLCCEETVGHEGCDTKIEGELAGAGAGGGWLQCGNMASAFPPLPFPSPLFLAQTENVRHTPPPSWHSEGEGDGWLSHCQVSSDSVPALLSWERTAVCLPSGHSRPLSPLGACCGALSKTVNDCYSPLFF